MLACHHYARRCHAGEPWAPDLAEFLGVAGGLDTGPFGLTVDDVLKAYKDCMHSGLDADVFPWKHPVLYQIYTDMRRECVAKKLFWPEMEKLAAKRLEHWEKKVSAGFSVPPIRRQLEAPKAPKGPSPIEQMAAGKRYVE